MINIKICLLAVFLLISTAAIEKVKPVVIDPSDYEDSTPMEFALVISNSQPEIIQKAVLHYLKEEVPALSKVKSAHLIKEELSRMFSREHIAETSQKIENFMRARLFVRLGKIIIKLDMDSLASSFKKEIESHPDDYFLTFDMYDLLIDE